MTDVPWGWIIFFLLWLFCGIFGTAGKETLNWNQGYEMGE